MQTNTIMNVCLNGLTQDSPDVFKVTMEVLSEFNVIKHMIEDFSDNNNNVPLGDVTVDMFTLAIDVLLNENPNFYDETMSESFSPKDIKSCTNAELCDLIKFYDMMENIGMLELSYQAFAQKNFGKLPADFD